MNASLRVSLLFCAILAVLFAHRAVAQGVRLTTGDAVTPSAAPPDAVTDRASDHNPVPAALFQIADLAVTKIDTPDPVTAGSNLTYTITITNNGPDPASTASWSDMLPAGTTFVSLPTVAGWSCSPPPVGPDGTVSCSNPSFAVGSAVFTLTVNVGSSVAAGTVLTNTATAKSAAADGNPGNEMGTATTTVAASADLSATKVDTPDPVNAGNQITYTVTVTNAGPSNAASVTMSDAIPAGTTLTFLAAPGAWVCPVPASGDPVVCTHPSLPVGTSVFTIKAIVDPTIAAGTVLTNTVTVSSSSTSDPNPGNENGTATTTVAAYADLSVTKVETPDPVNAGDQVTYTVTVTNAGPNNAASVTMSDALPAGTTFTFLAAPGAWVCPVPASGGPVVCTHASLPVGTSVFTIKVIVDPATAAGTVLTNKVTVSSSSTSDPNPGNENGTATTTVAAYADLSVTKVATPDPVDAGTNLAYTITVTNNGPSNAATASLSDTLPSGTTFVSLSSAGGWSCTTPAVGAAGTVACTNLSVTIGSSVFTLTVDVSPTAGAGSVISNTATVVSATLDPNTGNESDTETTNVISPATVTGTKTRSGPLTPGSTVTYTIVLSNAGPAAQNDNPGNELVDVLPAPLTLVSATASAGGTAVGTNIVTWNGSIAAAGSVTITIQAIIPSNVALGTTISNQATVNYDSDGNGTNEASGVTDDPSIGGAGQATGFVVLAPATLAAVPALDVLGVTALAALLGALGVVLSRRL